MGWGKSHFTINSPCSCAKSHVKKYQEGKSEGYEIVCLDGSFHVHEYCLYNSEFLYNMVEGMDSFIYREMPSRNIEKSYSHVMFFLMLIPMQSQGEFSRRRRQKI